MMSSAPSIKSKLPIKGSCSPIIVNSRLNLNKYPNSADKNIMTASKLAIIHVGKTFKRVIKFIMNNLSYGTNPQITTFYTKRGDSKNLNLLGYSIHLLI